MAPVYKCYMGKWSEAWHQLSPEEQLHITDQQLEAADRVGMRHVILCDSSWCSEQWQFFGVEEFPNIEAEQRYTQLLHEINWFRYTETITVLGIPWGPRHR